MLVSDLTRGISGRPPLLRYLSRASVAPRGALASQSSFTDVVLWDGIGVPEKPVRGALVIASPWEFRGTGTVDPRRGAEQWIAALAQRGAVGVVAVDADESEAPRDERSSLPVFAPHEPCSGYALQLRVLRAQRDAEREGYRQIGELVDWSNRLLRRGEGPEPLLRWLEGQTGSQVTLLQGPGDWARLGVPLGRQLLEQLVGGGTQTGTWSDGGKHVLLHALGRDAPHAVLVASRGSAWSGAQRELVTHAASQIGLLCESQARREQERRLEASTAAVRVAVLHDLMRGHADLAGLKLRAMLPDLLVKEWMRFGVLRCPEGENVAAVRAECDRALGGGRW